MECARPGDLLLLPSHEAPPALLGLIGRLQRSGWQPGRALPDQAAPAAPR